MFAYPICPEEVFWLVKKSGFTEIRHASEDPRIMALYQAGDQLGILWKEKYFTDSDPY